MGFALAAAAQELDRLLRRGKCELGLHDPRLTLPELQDLVGGVVEEREKAVVVFLADRIEFVVVALRARERGPEPDRRRRVDPIDERLHRASSSSTPPS